MTAWGWVQLTGISLYLIGLGFVHKVKQIFKNLGGAL